jgi:phosphatidylserine/phosphatidylglycerophosphate/cardiolipin synthase-like enzyme
VPSFQPPFDSSQATASVVGAVLPDRRDRDATFTNFARYPGLVIRFLATQPSAPATAITLAWPASSTVRLVDLPPVAIAALGVDQLVELSPLPFAIAPVLRALAPGLPTFYLGFAGAPLPLQDGAVSTADPPFDVSRVVLGCMFQDRVSLEPWGWIDLIGDALARAAPEEAAAWRSLATLFAGQRGVQVRDAAGAPAAGETFRFRFLGPAGGVVRETALVSNAEGDLGAAALPGPGERAEVTWQPVPLAGDEALPVLALYEPSRIDPADDATRAFPGGDPLVLPEGFAGAHLQALDLARWYAPVVVSPQNPQWPSRFHPHSRVEPLVDGLDTYRLLIEDMRLASGIHLSGWAFVDFPMRPHDPGSSLSELLESLGRDKFRILVTKSFQPKVGVLDALATDALVVLLLLMVAAEPLIAQEKLGAFDNRGLLVWPALAVLLWVIVVLGSPDDSVENLLREVAEFTKEPMRRVLYDISGGKPPCAFPAPHPVALADNPISHNFALPGFGNLSEVQELWGVYHHKLQVFARETVAGTRYSGYVGGIDINSNRLDSPGHHGAGFRLAGSAAAPRAAPYHDVHARVTGPATLDLVGLFQERYEHALASSPEGVVQDPLFTPPPDPPGPPGPAFAPPDPATDPIPAAGQHLVRIGQTSFKPGPGREGFPWAPDGDAPIRETFERAIRSAREYIYIEDQYFTLDNPLIELLRQAADHCTRLVILVAASTTDQLFGDERRLATFERLSGATGGPGGWGDRMIAGSPFRRSVLGPAEFKASMGRASLLENIESATAAKIYVGPVLRVPPAAPYFFWVGGELMYATKARRLTSPGGFPSVEIEVLRGSFQGTQPPWCPHPRKHEAGTPVTFSAPRDIFVHAKLLMVDDVFVAIGSCNWNRRGFYHDGEVDAFAIPDRLKAAADNPAFLLRTALWAEHLGLPPLMGRALLADPVEAYELFRRSRYEGNRFCQHREFVAPRGDLSALNDLELFQLVPDAVKTTLLATANSFMLTQIPNIWNTVSDPTTGNDPNPTEGPQLP